MMEVKKIGYEDSTGSEMGPLMVSYKHVNSGSGSIKWGGGGVVQLSDYQR
jgi:hypothetical protein